MDAIKAIADGIRAERKAEIEKSTAATAADVVQAVAPQQTDKKAPEPEAEPAEGNNAGTEGTPPAAPEDDTKE